MNVDPLWYKNAVIYEVHVRSFFDSNGDGIGDFRGLTQKLDYLQDLGVTALWLLPFYPSPLKDDGYDIADYTRINPIYGTMADFRQFLREAHRRDLRVITELVINHTSDQHPWFQRARRSPPGSKARNFYVWSDTPDRYAGTRVIFQDFERSNWTFDETANAYYWHRFYHHQPDLNFDNPAVHKAVLEVLDFWLDMGVDGLRLDAVPYLYERDGTSCENLPETHAFLKKLRRHVDERYEARMLLAEANQWPEDAAAYFGDGDECHMNFHFPVMPRLFMAIRMEDRFPVVDILKHTPQIPETSQWALFLRNHDELTLEMVTDEDRDYMVRVYAHDRRSRVNLGIRRRLAPLLDNNRRRIELMNGLLFSLPGTPVLYYADEIGIGDNIWLGDRNGMRTPMQWSSDKNAGFSSCNPQRLFLPIIIDPEYHYEAVNVEAQQGNPSSLLWWMKRIIALRKKFLAFGRGSMEFLYPRNHRVLAFLRQYEDQTILVVANLSRFVQYAELDLSAFRGSVPVELFARTRFPAIEEKPYFLSLGPHSFFWFALENSAAATPPSTASPEETATPSLSVSGRWEHVLRPLHQQQLQSLLPAFLKKCRWFGGKSRLVTKVLFVEAIPLTTASSEAFVCFLRVSYTSGEDELYVLPLAWASGEQAELRRRESPNAIVASLSVTDPETGDGTPAQGLIYDASADPAFAEALVLAVIHRQRFSGLHGKLLALPMRGSAQSPDLSLPLPKAVVLQAEQSNTSVAFEPRAILKLYRRVEPGINSDVEVSRFLTERTSFTHMPALLGSLEYRSNQTDALAIGFVQSWVPNEGDAWRHTLDCLSRYFERILALGRTLGDPRLPREPLMKLVAAPVPELAEDLLGSYFHSAQLLGQRTAGLHLALSSDASQPDFAPEPIPPHYQQALYQSARSLGARALSTLQAQLPEIAEPARALAERVLGLEERLDARLRALLNRELRFQRIRCHGDYHLGQLLYTGRDFVILDFEGEPARSLGDRRLKRSALRDVAGMLRSFQYAAAHALRQETLRPQDVPALDGWGRYWECWVSVVFLQSYFQSAAGAPFLPGTSESTQVLLDVLLLEKALYELLYELNHRPDWITLPMKGILRLVEGG